MPEVVVLSIILYLDEFSEDDGEEVSEAIDNALLDDDIGEVVDMGTGYADGKDTLCIEVEVEDESAGIQLITLALKRLNVPKSTVLIDSEGKRHRILA